MDKDYRLGNFTGLLLGWVNQPSTLQPAHRYHGKNVVAVHEKSGGFRCCIIDDEIPSTIHLPEGSISPLGSDGWKK